mgnify:CR=1 FL=1
MQYSYAKAKAQLIKLVNREARRVQFLLDSDRLTAVDKALFSELLDREMEEDTLVSSLQELTELLEIHFGQQVIVLIDDMMFHLQRQTKMVTTMKWRYYFAIFLKMY